MLASEIISLRCAANSTTHLQVYLAGETLRALIEDKYGKTYGKMLPSALNLWQRFYGLSIRQLQQKELSLTYTFNTLIS